MNIHKLQLLNPKIKSLRCEKPFEIKVREYIRNFADPVHECTHHFR